MKVTPYGVFASLGVFMAISMIELNPKLLAVFLLSIYIQSELCQHCKGSYNMVSFIAVFPILILLSHDCSDTYKIIVAFSLCAAVGRMGCYFAGCCTGNVDHEKHPLSIKYEGGYVVNIITGKEVVYVKPTILIEIVLQILIVLIILKAKHPLVLFGILNAILLYMTSKWRMSGRRGLQEVDTSRISILSISISSLVVFALISYSQCKYPIRRKLKFNFTSLRLIISVVIGLMASNDINFNSVDSNENMNSSRQLKHPVHNRMSQ